MELANHPLEMIIEYGMDASQAKAFKMVGLWFYHSRKYFPAYKFGRGGLSKGDPRKTHVFRCCYKAVRELEGNLNDNDLRLFVIAQLQIMRAITDGEAHPLIDPHCLCAKQSWPRWCVWKKKYDERLKGKNYEKEQVVEQIDNKSAKDIDRAKEFLVRMFKGPPTYPGVKIAVDDRGVVRWAKLKKLTPFYPCLSPWVKKALGAVPVGDYLQMDLTLYKVTPAIETYFRTVFAYEFAT